MMVALAATVSAYAQPKTNSPFSRFGLGDLNDPNFSTIRELNLPKLSAQDKTQLESDITLDECYVAIRAMPENKSLSSSSCKVFAKKFSRKFT